MELWLYTHDDPYPNMPIFEGTREECIATIEEIASEYHDELWSATGEASWENVNGDQITMEG